MSSFQTHHKVNHNADKMFALVADVEMYPEFVPYCQALNVRGKKEQPDGTYSNNCGHDCCLQIYPRDIHQQNYIES